MKHVPAQPEKERDEMNINAAYPSNYLKSAELEGDLVCTIAKVVTENVGSDKEPEEKPVVYFEGHDKGLVLNKTNAATIADLYGPETDDWTGKAVTLFTTEVDFQGRQVLAIRVRLRKPTAAPRVQPASGSNGELIAAKTMAWKKFIVKTTALEGPERIRAFDEAITQLLGPDVKKETLTIQQATRLGNEISASWDIVNGFPHTKRFKAPIEDPTEGQPTMDLENCPFP